MKKILMSMALCTAVLAAACTGDTHDETDAQRLARKTVACLAIADAEPSPEVADRYMECMQEVFRFDDSLNAASPSLVETEEFVAEYKAALKVLEKGLQENPESQILKSDMKIIILLNIEHLILL